MGTARGSAMEWRCQVSPRLSRTPATWGRTHTRSASSSGAQPASTQSGRSSRNPSAKPRATWELKGIPSPVFQEHLPVDPGAGGQSIPRKMTPSAGTNTPGTRRKDRFQGRGGKPGSGRPGGVGVGWGVKVGITRRSPASHVGMQPGNEGVLRDRGGTKDNRGGTPGKTRKGTNTNIAPQGKGKKKPQQGEKKEPKTHRFHAPSAAVQGACPGRRNAGGPGPTQPQE